MAQHRNAIDAAKRAGVKRIVYTSVLRADISPLSLAPEHKETESLVKASGLAYTFLRNGWYTENYTGSIAGALAGGAFIGSAGEGRIASASRADYAAAAVAVLTSPGHDGKTYDSPATTRTRSQISPPRSRARAARRSRTRTCPRPTTPRR